MRHFSEASSGFEKPVLPGDFFAKKSPGNTGFSKPELASEKWRMTHREEKGSVF
jgi:hypothetical protein